MTGQHAENQEFGVPNQKIVTMTNFWFGTLGRRLLVSDLGETQTTQCWRFGV